MDEWPNKGFLENVEMMCDVIPKAGKIIIYTSGCSKNQNICWKRTGSPPPAASKKDVPK